MGQVDSHGTKHVQEISDAENLLRLESVYV